MITNPLRWPLYLQTIIAIVLAFFVGIFFGTHTGNFGVVSKTIIEIVKVIATPLLFFAILDAMLGAEFKGKGVFWMVAVSLFDALCAITIALCISNFMLPGTWMPLPRRIDRIPLSDMKGWIPPLDNVLPKHFFAPSFSGNIPAAIIVAIAVGGILLLLERLLKPKSNFFVKIRSGVHKALEGLLVVIGWAVKLVPLAVFAGIAKVVGEHGFSLLPGLGAYFIACLLGMVLQVGVVYQTWIVFISKIGFKRFWKEAKEPSIYSFGVNSSLATLPVTLKHLDKLGVSPGSARLAACVGTNLNNDGILLYEVVAALFIAQAHGLHLTLGQQMAVAVICVIATIGIAGIPEAGIISLTLVLGTIGLPVDGLALLLSVDWVIARCRSVTNVLSDMTVAIAIDTLSFQKRAEPLPS